MSQKFGVKKELAKTLITAWESNDTYDYVVTCEQVSQHNGNGLCKIKVYDNDNNHLEIAENGWTIYPVIDSPFNWSGSCIRPKVVDPKGQSREVYIDGYSQTIFKGLSYHKDVTALFNVLQNYSSFNNWCEFDLKELEKEKDEVINILQLEIIDLKNQLKAIQK